MHSYWWWRWWQIKEHCSNYCHAGCGGLGHCRSLPGPCCMGPCQCRWPHSRWIIVECWCWHCWYVGHECFDSRSPSPPSSSMTQAAHISPIQYELDPAGTLSVKGQPHLKLEMIAEQGTVHGRDWKTELGIK